MCALNNTCQEGDIIEMVCISNATTWPLGILFFCKQSSHLEHQMKNVNVLSRWCYVIHLYVTWRHYPSNHYNTNL
jgi:hypothetical protein